MKLCRFSNTDLPPAWRSSVKYCFIAVQLVLQYSAGNTALPCVPCYRRSGHAASVRRTALQQLPVPTTGFSVAILNLL
jgi:hypothetical protein